MATAVPAAFGLAIDASHGHRKCKVEGEQITALNQDEFAQLFRGLSSGSFIATHKIKGRPFGLIYFDTLEEATCFAEKVNGTQCDETCGAPISVTVLREAPYHSRKRGKRRRDHLEQIPPLVFEDLEHFENNGVRIDAESSTSGDVDSSVSTTSVPSPRSKKRCLIDAPSMPRTALQLSTSPTLPKLIDLKKKYQGRKIEWRNTTACDVTSFVTPLAMYNYNDQLEMKAAYAKTCIKRITKGVHGVSQKLPADMLKPVWCTPVIARGWHGCTMLPPVGCPPEGRISYRNKCEFTIGFSDDNCQTPEVGFVSSRRDFEPIIHSPNGCLHTPYAMQEVVSRMKFLVMHSKIPVYSRRAKQGIWRLFMVRSSEETKSLMIAAQIHADVTPEQEHAIRIILMYGLVGIQSEDQNELPAVGDSVHENNHEYHKRTTPLDAVFHPPPLRAAKPRGDEGGPGYDFGDFPSLCTHPRRDKTDRQRRYLYDGFRVTSLYIQKRKDVSDSFDSDTFEHVWGDKHIQVAILGLNFEISPNTFLQTNRVACELLYRCVLEWLTEPQDPKKQKKLHNSHSGTVGRPRKQLIFDVCSGAGTISLCLAQHLQMMQYGAILQDSRISPKQDDDECFVLPAYPANFEVIGIEMAESAVSDAEESAAKNFNKIGGSRVRFVCGKAENVLPELLDRLKKQTWQEAASEDPAEGGDDDDGACRSGIIEVPLKEHNKLNSEELVDVCAVVDPPRSGLHPAVLQALRFCEKIDRIIYISCSGDALVDNAIVLCQPTLHGSDAAPLPFRPVRAVTIDMFPHTFHCEIVVEFQRLNRSELEITST